MVIFLHCSYSSSFSWNLVFENCNSFVLKEEHLIKGKTQKSLCFNNILKNDNLNMHEGIPQSMCIPEQEAAALFRILWNEGRKASQQSEALQSSYHLEARSDSFKSQVAFVVQLI